MSPSAVMPRLVYPVPAAIVLACTVFAPTRRSFGLPVTTKPLSLVAVVEPCAPTAVSRGFNGSRPLYSAIRMSGCLAAVVNVTVTVFAPAPAAAMFFA